MSEKTEIRHLPGGAIAEVTEVAPGQWRHKNLTPGKGVCTFCGGPLDEDADMVAQVCTPCWDKAFGEDE